MELLASDLSSGTIGLLQYILPGFVAAWVFYALTSHPKPSQFERVVQALILTFAVHVLLLLVHSVLVWLGKITKAIGQWDELASLSISALLAIIVGIALAYYTNNDKFHARLRTWGFTTRTSHPSEWFCVLSKTVTFVILHLTDGRRLYGWPKEWPIDSDSGQFYIMMPSWIDADARAVDLPQVQGVLVRAKDVRWVEFISQELSV